MKPSDNALVAISTAAAGILVLVLVFQILGSSQFYFWQQKRMVRRVLSADPGEVRRAGRQLLAAGSVRTGWLPVSELSVPEVLRRLGAREVQFATNCVYVEFSDLCNPFGIIVYADDVSAPPEPRFGNGPHKWTNGLWVYDDGHLESYGQPVGQANGSQPIRSATNRTSSAAGSRR